MLYLYLLIGLIAGTLAERYILPVFDLLMSSFSNNKQLEAMGVKKKMTVIENEIELEVLDSQYEATLIKKDIGDIMSQMQPQDTHVVGYHMDAKHPEEDEEREDDDCRRCELMDCKSPNDNKIGF